jgi:predicted Zn-dependent protease with MMP-like domain
MSTDVSREQFETLVTAALDGIPGELLEKIDNCVILVEEFSPPDEPVLLGLYDGIPLTERGENYGAVLPDRILIFRQPILAICDTMEEVVRQVRITVVHEIAHHFGIDDERLHELGYG